MPRVCYNHRGSRVSEVGSGRVSEVGSGRVSEVGSGRVFHSTNQLVSED